MNQGTKSWIHPPELEVVDGAVENRGYDISQRAYVLACSPEGERDDLVFELEAGPDSPFVNACLILRDWGDADFGVRLDGQELGPGKGLRPSYERTLRGTDLVIWLEKISSEPMTMRITSVKGVKGSGLQ